MRIYRLFPDSAHQSTLIDSLAIPDLWIATSSKAIFFIMLLYIVAFVGTLAFILRAIYMSYQPGVRDLPGPFLARYTNWLRVYWAWKGDPWITYRNLKKQYGNAVRIGPNAILLSEQGQFDKILGFKEDFIKVANFVHGLENSAKDTFLV
jgi:hypothetical protein